MANCCPSSLSRTLAAIIANLVYGIQISSMNDEFVRSSSVAVEAIADAKMPGRYWIDYLPVLKMIPPWIPGAAARKRGDVIRPITLEMKNKPFDAVKAGNVKSKILPLRCCLHHTTMKLMSSLTRLPMSALSKRFSLTCPRTKTTQKCIAAWKSALEMLLVLHIQVSSTAIL